MTQPIALPTITAEGTDATTLQGEYCAVRVWTKAAADALSDATCAPRDFPGDPEAFQQAQADRREMFRLLEVVQDYAAQIEARAAEHITAKTPQAET
jgi:hypothetical protein